MKIDSLDANLSIVVVFWHLKSDRSAESRNRILHTRELKCHVSPNVSTTKGRKFVKRLVTSYGKHHYSIDSELEIKMKLKNCTIRILGICIQGGEA